MKYSVEKRKEIITSKPEDLDVRTYCKKIGIAYSTYYKWYNEFNTLDEDKSSSFIDITKLVVEGNTTIDLEISNITIHIKSDYSESHLIRLINTLKKL